MADVSNSCIFVYFMKIITKLRDIQSRGIGPSLESSLSRLHIDHEHKGQKNIMYTKVKKTSRTMHRKDVDEEIL